MRKALNDKVVCLEERWQVAYWTTALGCTESELRDALAATEPTVENVRKQLAAGKNKT